MILLKVLILILTFKPHDMTQLKCPTGEKVNRYVNGCDACLNGYYQDEENISKSCKLCDSCDFGSAIEKNCTRIKNTKCKCRENFTPWGKDHSTCKCDQGYGLTDGGKCEKCPEGFFTSTHNKPCKKWKECKSGVNVSGTATSDAVCNEPNSNSYITTLPTSNRITSPRSLTPQRPHGGAHTLNKSTTSAATTPRATTSIKNSTPTVYTGNHIGMALIIFGIAGLLVLTVVTCKLHITDCRHDQKPVQPAVAVDSFRKPVEESCEGNQFLLKSNLVEP